MESEGTENPNWGSRADPDANPLTTFGRDTEFTDELIKGICEKKDTTSLLNGGNTNSQACREKKYETRWSYNC